MLIIGAMATFFFFHFFLCFAAVWPVWYCTNFPSSGVEARCSGWFWLVTCQSKRACFFLPMPYWDIWLSSTFWCRSKFMCGAVALMRLVALTRLPGLPNRLLPAKYLRYLRPRKAQLCLATQLCICMSIRKSFTVRTFFSFSVVA